MNAKENYQTILDSIFGSGAVCIKIDDSWNNITGALNDAGNYGVFADNFKKRLERIRNNYSGTDAFKHIQTLLAEVANPRWANYTGAYAELSAYDCLQSPMLKQAIVMDKDVDANDTYALQMGKTVTNADGYFAEFDAYFDVKRMADNARILANNIIEAARKKASVKSNVLINAEYQIDTDYAFFEEHFADFVNELADELSTHCRTFTSNIYPVTFKVSTNGMVSTTSTYNPEEHAKNILHQLFSYTNKFVKNKPFFLVLIKLPWYNNLVNSSWDYNQKFYAELARKFFNDYDSKPDLMTSMISHYKGGETIDEVTRKVTGIIFIDDQCILGDADSLTQTQAFVYLNHRADNVVTSDMDNYLKSIKNSGSNGVYQIL